MNNKSTGSEITRLKRLQKRIEHIVEEIEELVVEVEEVSPWSTYYTDPEQAATEAMWFHDQRLPWLALEQVKYLIYQLEYKLDEEMRAYLASLPTVDEDIPF